MCWLKYPIFKNGYINRFLISDVFVRESPYSDGVLSGRVNEWLVKGPAIHDHPDRARLVADRRGQLPPYIGLGELRPGDVIESFGRQGTMKVYFPFGNTGISCPEFYRNPARLRMYGVCYIDVPAGETAQFILSSCGAFTLWVNGELITDFAPLERNAEHSTAAEAGLTAGLNRIEVCIEDIAERDTDFGFRLRYCGTQDIMIMLPAGDRTDCEKLSLAEEALAGMYFDRDCYRNEQVKLNIRSFSDGPVLLNILSDNCRTKEKYMLNPGEDSVLLFEKGANPTGFCRFLVWTEVSGISIGKVIGTYFLDSGYGNPGGDTYEERRRIVRDIIARKGGTNEYSMLVNLSLGTPLPNTDEIIRGQLEWIVNKKDCSDFRMLPVAYAYARFRHLLSDAIIREIEDAMLGYRYWCDEPGNDVMWFFSENHAALFHVSQYIAGRSLPDRVFTVSGLKGSDVALKAERLMNEWFDTFSDEFVTEWNSSTYVPVDVAAVAFLYDFADEGSMLKSRAKRALDMLAFSFAVNEHKGTILTSFGRTYEKELKGSYSTGVPSLLYLWYNAGHMNSHFRALTPLVLGDYEPPCEYSEYVGLTGRRELIYRNTQGIDNFVNLYLYKNSRTVLSTAVGHRPYGRGYQENIMEAAIDGTAQVFINHPGEIQDYGNGRPGLWAGNGSLPEAGQSCDVSILRYRIPDDDPIDFTHAYVPLAEFDGYRIGRDTAVLFKDGGYIGLKALNGFEMTAQGPRRNRELVSPGRENVWLVKVGTDASCGGADELFTELMCTEITVGGDSVCVVNAGRRYVLSHAELTVDGEKAYDYPTGVIGTPVMKGQ